jgi:hypothetical protein
VQKRSDSLDVVTITVIDTDHHVGTRRVLGRHDLLDPRCVERQRALAQDGHPLRQCRDGVDLVQVIWRANHHGVWLGVSQKIDDVIEDSRHAKPTR